mmetsp:Transcript_29396/g.75998  ORF Transcript_29396/g.75998 Transcript_29396/m.75998 type:complete len:289 (+) Transcript_29396:115-981(+)|eukprot:jgi/Tetstr1/456049/TSEL_042819.t1
MPLLAARVCSALLPRAARAGSRRLAAVAPPTRRPAAGGDPRSANKRVVTPWPHRRRSLATATGGCATPVGAMDAGLVSETFFLDEFAQRQWDDPNYSGTRISFDKAEFVARVQKSYEEGGKALVDGYAPFCKHVIIPNFVGAKVGCLAITEENKGLLRCGYSRRRPDELAVLTRWFPESLVEVPDAKMLDVILYSREQLIQEYRARMERQGGPVEDPDLPDSPWGIISIKAQDEAFETPMQPITMMRNALGKEEGGSGVTLDRGAYEASTAYWQDHAPIVAGEMPSGD